MSTRSAHIRRTLPPVVLLGAIALSLLAGDSTSSVDSLSHLVIEDTLDFVDVDTSLWRGQGVLLAFEDTIPFAEGTIETLLVSAKRLSVAEVVRLIGERMEEERAKRREHTFTAVTKAILYYGDEQDDLRKWETIEQADRIRFNSDDTFQQARLWLRERKYENDEMVEEKINEKIESSWDELSEAMMEAIPFSLQSGDKYNYDILDRKMLGLNVVYEVSFEPKNQFKALPKGRVWLDTSDWVIRRVEAEMTDAVPLPLFIKSIPIYKFRMKQVADFWVLDDVFAEIELRDIPLVKTPASVEFYLQTSHHQINGVKYDDEDGDS